MDDDEVMLSGRVPVADLAMIHDPLDGTEWDCDPIDRTEVMAAVGSGVTEPESWQAVNRRHRGKPFDDHAFHVRRLAHLVAHPDDKPIELEVEGMVDRYGDNRRVRVYDGGHRLGAAILRGDETIRFAVREFEAETLLELLPSAEIAAMAPSP